MKAPLLAKAGTYLTCPHCGDKAVRLKSNVYDLDGIAIEAFENLQGLQFQDGDIPACRRCEIPYLHLRGDDGFALHTENGWVPFDPRH